MIIQGDNGTYLKLYIKENNELLDLSDAVINVKIKNNMRSFTKDASIVGLGECEVQLFSNDVDIPGIYLIQASINYTDGNIFSSSIGTFKVEEKI